MKNLFEKQLKGNTVMTEQTIGQMSTGKYYNDEPYQIGEVVLFAMLVGEVIEKQNDIPEMPIRLITLNERHFPAFNCPIRLQSGNLPVVKLNS